MDSTTYNIKVVSTTLTHHLADAVIDVCRAHLDGSLPSLDEGHIKNDGHIEITSNEHQITFHPNHLIELGVYQIPMGHRDDVFEALVTLAKSVDDDCDVEVIEFSPETDENNTIMSTYVDGERSEDFTCFIDGTAGISIEELMRHAEAGDLEDFVRQEHAKLLHP